MTCIVYAAEADLQYTLLWHGSIGCPRATARAYYLSPEAVLPRAHCGQRSSTAAESSLYT